MVEIVEEYSQGRWAKASRLRVIRQKSLGLCLRCPKPHAPGYVLCITCHDRERKRNLYNKYRKHGYSIEWRDKKLQEQECKCYICGIDFKIDTPRPYCIDHNHATGRLRGLLCHGCNGGLGFIEKLGWLEKATAYLEKYD